MNENYEYKIKKDHLWLIALYSKIECDLMKRILSNQ